jgi:hypothetical protein
LLNYKKIDNCPKKGYFLVGYLDFEKMIYYTISNRILMQRIQDCVTRSKCQMVNQLPDLQFSNNEALFNFIEKWAARYQLRMTPKQRYDAKKKGLPTFDLLVHLPLARNEEFTKSVIEQAKNQPDFFSQPDLDLLSQSESYCPVRFFLFCNIDSEKVYNHSISSFELNNLLKKQIEGCEDFIYVHEDEITVEGYEFVRLTQKRSLVAEIEGQVKNKYDWTWRLTQSTYGNLHKAGEQLINRFNHQSSKTDEEKKQYFEKHFKILESLHGFRGVRKQIGQIYNAEKKEMKRQYGEKSLQYYRPLILKYMQRTKDQVPSNSEPDQLLAVVKRLIDFFVKKNEK